MSESIEEIKEKLLEFIKLNPRDEFTDKEAAAYCGPDTPLDLVRKVLDDLEKDWLIVSPFRGSF